MKEDVGRCRKMREEWKEDGDPCSRQPSSTKMEHATCQQDGLLKVQWV